MWCLFRKYHWLGLSGVILINSLSVLCLLWVKYYTFTCIISLFLLHALARKQLGFALLNRGVHSQMHWTSESARVELQRVPISMVTAHASWSEQEGLTQKRWWGVGHILGHPLGEGNCLEGGNVEIPVIILVRESSSAPRALCTDVYLMLLMCVTRVLVSPFPRSRE